MKTISSELSTHLSERVTTLATIWRVTREDGLRLNFTDHDQDLTVAGVLYKASTGYQRTALSINAQLSVDNLDIQGIYADTGITETELRSGLFDYASVEIAVVNWDDTSQGELQLKKGRLGEVAISTQGFYTAEVRGLTQQLSQTLLTIYQPECRVDLGSPECGIPIIPNTLDRNAEVILGEFYHVPTGGSANPVYIANLLNGSFEEDSTGSYTTGSPPTGWEIVGANGWRIVTAENGLTAQDGSNFVTGLAFDSSEELRQDVAVVTGLVTEALIDAGEIQASFSGWMANVFSLDTGRIRIEFLNSSMSLISTGLDTGLIEITPITQWQQQTMSLTLLPVGTRYIRVRLDYSLVDGTTANSAFDNMVLSIQNNESLVSTLTPLVDPSFEVDAVGTYSTGVPMTNWNILSGSWDIVTAFGGESAHEGSNFLVGTDTVDVGTMEQVITTATMGISDFDINGGYVKCNFSIRVNDTTGNLSDYRVTVDFLDVSGNSLLQGLNTGLVIQSPSDTWHLVQMPITTMPRDTKSIRVFLEYDRSVTETQSGIGFDDAHLFVFLDRPSQYENRVYEVTTAGTTADKLPTYDTDIDDTTTDGTAVLTARDAFYRNGVVGLVTDRRTFKIGVDEPRAVDSWFKGGAMFIYNGPNAGRTVEIKEWTQVTNEIELFLPLPFPIETGTLIGIYRGCQKRLDEDCVDIFDNAINFRGEPFIPGTDTITRYPDAR